MIKLKVTLQFEVVSMKRFLLTTLSLLSISGAIAPLTQAEAIITDGQPLLLSQQVNTPASLASGSFVTIEQDHATTGQARIVTEKGQRYLEFDANFDTARGPAVEVVLHRSPAVGVKLKEGDYVSLAPLKSFTGAQRYLIPANVDLSNYKSVAIWCEEFNVTFGYAPLN
jgi:hypothetical protein